MKLLGLRHKNTIFNEAYLPLNKKGVTQIRGINKDSNAGHLTDPNAVGKSVLVRPISEVIFASSPLTTSVKAKAKKDLFCSKDSEMEIMVEKDGDVFSFKKVAKGASYEYVVEENQQDVKIRRKDYTEAKIKDFFGYSEDEFYTQWYIDSGRISPLQIGTATQRINFFTNMFKLEDSDEMRKIINALLKESKLKEASYRTLKSELEELGEVPKDLSKLEKKVEQKENEKEEVVSGFEELNNRLLLFQIVTGKPL